MNSDDYGRLIYLVVLAAAIGGSMLLSYRGALGRMAQQLSIWGLIFVGVAAGYGLWSDISASRPRLAVVDEQGSLQVPQAPDGHYYLTLMISGQPVDFMIDTGASEVVLSQQDATRIGIDVSTLSYFGEASTANGMVRTARVTLEDVVLAGTDEGSLRAWVNEGELDISLLGMSFLHRFASMEFSDGILRLTR
jgi:aspartyl protease family protein